MLLVRVSPGAGEDWWIVRVAPRCPWAALSSAIPIVLSVSLMATVSPAGIEKLAVPIVCALACLCLALLAFPSTVNVNSPLHVAFPVHVSLTAALPLLATVISDPTSETLPDAGFADCVGVEGAGVVGMLVVGVLEVCVPGEVSVEAGWVRTANTVP